MNLVSVVVTFSFCGQSAHFQSKKRLLTYSKVVEAQEVRATLNAFDIPSRAMWKLLSITFSLQLLSSEGVEMFENQLKQGIRFFWVHKGPDSSPALFFSLKQGSRKQLQQCSYKNKAWFLLLLMSA